jgi:hypothetical protein
MKIDTKFYFLFILLLILPVCAIAQDDMSGNIHLNKYPVPEIKYKDQSLYADFFDNHVFERLEKYLMFSTKSKELLGIYDPAQRVNAFDEVPDSTLFTNRNGKKLMRIEDIKKGADTGPGPDTNGKWIIKKGKVEGRNPGFFIVDSTGEKYLIKLDRKKYPEMISSCEVIGSKFFYAMGYNVPQNTICYFNPDILTVAEDARFYDSDGFEKTFTLEKALTLLEESAYRNRDGYYRAVASKILDGVPKGYVSFRSNRRQDENDIVAHQNRREIRGYKVFSSWLNHHDARRGNTLDMLIESENGWYLKQYMIDFGSCLGSHNMFYKYAEAGNTYVIDMWETLKAWFSLGFYKRPYHRPVVPFSPAVGYITSDIFEPGEWKPMIPNFAFDTMTNRDAYWAAKIVMSFTDEQIKALVDTGQLSISRDREYLTKIIIERRDKIGEYWFRQVNPLDMFILDKNASGYSLSFENLYAKYGFGKDAVSYDVAFIDADGHEAVKATGLKSETIPIPAAIMNNTPFTVRIRSKGAEKSWYKAVDVLVSNEMQISGIIREN